MKKIEIYGPPQQRPPVSTCAYLTWVRILLAPYPFLPTLFCSVHEQWPRQNVRQRGYDQRIVLIGVYAVGGEAVTVVVIAAAAAVARSARERVWRHVHVSAQHNPGRERGSRAWQERWRGAELRETGVPPQCGSPGPRAHGRVQGCVVGVLVRQLLLLLLPRV